MIKIKTLFKQIFYGLSVMAIALMYCPNIVSASQITVRSVTIGSSMADAVSTTYDFTFTVPSSTNIKSVSFTPCLTASAACGTVTNFDAASSTLTSQPTNLGDANGWDVDGTSTALRLKKTGNLSTPTPATPTTVKFSNVHNPSAVNSTFYIRISTFSDDSYTTLIDSGVVATSTAGQITATATVDETLNFTLANAVVDLGTLTKTATGKGVSTMTIGTNATNGYSLSYSGGTLTSGTNTITPMTVADDSTQNSKQFGINLMENVTPAIGSNVSGSGTGIATTGYDTQDKFKFNPSGDVIASASLPTNDNVFTTSYIANIDSSTAAGIYSTVLTYVVTANF